MSWSDEDLKKLRKLSRSLTLHQLAKEMNKPVQAVRWQIRKNGWHTTVPWKRTFAELETIKLYSDIHGRKAAGDKFGCTESVIKNIRKRYKAEVAKLHSKVTEKDLTHIRSIAISVAHKNNYSNHADDFGSYCVIYRMTHDVYNLDWLWANYMRETVGDVRNSTGRLRHNSMKFSKQVVEEIDDDNIGSAIVPSVEPSIDTFYICRVLDGLNLKTEQYIAFMLHVHFGLRYNEIALAFGVNPQKISQILKDTNRIVQAAIASQP